MGSGTGANTSSFRTQNSNNSKWLDFSDSGYVNLTNLQFNQSEFKPNNTDYTFKLGNLVPMGTLGYRFRDVAGTVLMDILNTGKVGIGTAGPEEILSIASAGAVTPGILHDLYTATTGRFPYFAFRKSGSNTKGTVAATENGDILGKVLFKGVDSGSSYFRESASIIATANAAPDADTQPAMLQFATSDTSSNQVRMTISDDGNVGIGTVDPNKVLHVVGDIEISGAIYQSGSIFEGGGGGGSSTFAGLSDTPGSLTANKYLSVNSAGNAVEMVDAVQSGYATLDQEIFTGFDLTGSAVGIVQNASGSMTNLNLASNKWDVSIIEETDSQVTTGDANWSAVKLLLPFDGSNGATSTQDSSSSVHTVTLNSSTISTAQSKWGGSSLDLTGSTDASIAYSSDFDFGSDDFTVECWVRFNSNAAGYWMVVNDHTVNSGWSQATFYATGQGSGMKIQGGSYDSGMKWTAYSSEVALNTWHHVASVRYNNKIYLYINGTAVDSGTTVSGAFRNNSQPVLLGRRHYDAGINMYMDDLRISKGLARYTANFTPTTEAFNAVINITETKYISQIGGWDDTDVDYGIKKISNSELSIKKMGADDVTRPIDRLYVNVERLGSLGQGIAFDQVYTGDGVTTNYLLADNVPSARDVLVSVQGFVQTPNIDYTLAGTTGVSFTTGVTSGDEVSLRYLAMGGTGAPGPAGAAGGGSFAKDVFTGNGVVSGFTMGRSVSNILETTVFVNGLAQFPDDNYFTNGTSLTFASGDIASGDLIMVRHMY